MGLTVNSLPVMDGLATINDVYVNIRDIRYTKEEGEYVLEFMIHYQRDTKHIKTEFKNIKLADFYDGNIWSRAYEVLKSDLSDKSLTHQDA